MNYKWCLVPLCTNTSIRTPNKIFLTVPKSKELRLKWLKAIRRKEKISMKSTCYCCEDHFDLKEDLQNFMRFSMMGGPALMKPGVVPHIFNCQPDGTSTHSHQPRPGSVKREHLEALQEAIESNHKYELQDPLSEETNLPIVDVDCIKQEAPEEPCTVLTIDNVFHIDIQTYVKMEPESDTDAESPSQSTGVPGPSCKEKWNFSDVYSDSE